MTTNEIGQLLEKFQKLNLKPYFKKNNEYFDEPKFYSFGGELGLSRKHTDGILSHEPPTGSGTSFFSSETALSNCIYETMERFCSYYYKKKSLKWASYVSNPKLFMDPALFSTNNEIRSKKMYWTKGVNLTNGKKCLIPSQLLYLNYKWMKNEPRLQFPYNSNGSASGATTTHAILNGIYEACERDAFMSVYLAKISPPSLNLDKINDIQIKEIVKKISRYRLELHVLDVTTDINIPTYFAVLIDRTGLGPALSCGAKASINNKNAIIGAITESLMCRLYVKEMLQKGSISEDLSKGKNVFSDRARYWIHPDSLKNIEFLISGKIVTPKFSRQNLKMEDELKIIKQKLVNVGFDTYYSDYSFSPFGKNFIAGKVIIPKLQTMYLDEKFREWSINEKRLKEVSQFFKHKFNEVNSYPHPFL